MRRIVLYAYHVDEERLSQTLDMTIERDIVNIESRNEHELIYAIPIHGNRNTRLAIASRPGKVYFDQDATCYRVWFDTPDKDKAIEEIGNYILDRIHPEIKYHESFIKRLEDEKK
mgnify:CR=1 FL=1